MISVEIELKICNQLNLEVESLFEEGQDRKNNTLIKKRSRLLVLDPSLIELQARFLQLVEIAVGRIMHF